MSTMTKPKFSTMRSAHRVVNGLMREVERLSGIINASSRQIAHQSTLLIEKEGMIENLKAAAREMAEYPNSDAAIVTRSNEKLRDELERTKATLAEREKFKAYVHQRLDESGIEKFENEKCRIGHRLNAVFAQVDQHRSEIESWRARNLAAADGLMKARAQIQQLTRDLIREGAARQALTEDMDAQVDLRKRACEAYERLAKERGGRATTLRDEWAMAIFPHMQGMSMEDALRESYIQAEALIAKPIDNRTPPERLRLYGKPKGYVPNAQQVGVYGVNMAPAKDANRTDAEAAAAQPNTAGVFTVGYAGDRSVEIPPGVLPDDDDEDDGEPEF